MMTSRTGGMLTNTVILLSLKALQIYNHSHVAIWHVLMHRHAYPLVATDIDVYVKYIEWKDEPTTPKLNKTTNKRLKRKFKDSKGDFSAWPDLDPSVVHGEERFQDEIITGLDALWRRRSLRPINDFAKLRISTFTPARSAIWMGWQSAISLLAAAEKFQGCGFVWNLMLRTLRRLD